MTFLLKIQQEQQDSLAECKSRFVVNKKPKAKIYADFFEYWFSISRYHSTSVAQIYRTSIVRSTNSRLVICAQKSSCALKPNMTSSRPSVCVFKMFQVSGSCQRESGTCGSTCKAARAVLGTQFFLCDSAGSEFLRFSEVSLMILVVDLMW